MAHYKKFRLSTLAAVVGIVLAVGPENSYAEAPIQFNTRFLDVKDDASTDLSRFSRKGYIMPGSYHLRVLVNQSQIVQIMLLRIPLIITILITPIPVYRLNWSRCWG